MKSPQLPSTRRAFLQEVGKGVLTAAIGTGMAQELGIAAEVSGETKPRLEFGELEPLVRTMQETPAPKLLPLLAEKLRAGTPLKTLVTAGALANARTFGGEDYIGFHTMMAISPSLHMAQQQPPGLEALPVFKVLYRNTNRIQEIGGPAAEVLHPVAAAANEATPGAGERLRDAVRAKDLSRAEAIFMAAAQTPEDALNAVLYEVQDETEVHRVALPYRAWDLLGLIGKEHATTLLRQSVRYCVTAEQRWARDRSRSLLARLLEEHHLLDRQPGLRAADDAWVEAMSNTIFNGTAEQAATATAAALAEGFTPDALGEAISLAANQLILRDHGRTPLMEITGKPIGSVHGDSIGVHACDSAGAWRNLARAAAPRNQFACLILGAYQVALDRVERGGDFLNWEPFPLQRRLAEIKNSDAASLLGDLEEAVRGNLQMRATSIVHRYGELGHEPRAAFDLLRKYAISEDGALHAEKFYQTTSEEFATTRPKFRWRQLCALARVTASEYGRPAPGMEQARELVSRLTAV